MRGLVVLVFLTLAVAGCGGGSSGFYDDDAKGAAERAARARLDWDGEIAAVGSARERRDCPQAPSPSAGPCLNVEIDVKADARPVTGGDSVGTLEGTLDAFVWLTQKGERWKVTYVTYRPRGVSFEGVPYGPSN